MPVWHPRFSVPRTRLQVVDRDDLAHVNGVDAPDDADVELDTADSGSQSSSSPDEPPPSDLLTPLTPMWYLPLDDDDTRPSGILEVSTLLSRPLVSSPPRLPAPAVQATDGDRMTLPCGPNYSKVES
jgi:hypothetical protein